MHTRTHGRTDAHTDARTQKIDNCALLNGAPGYFDGGLVRMRHSGTFHIGSTRNNNFSNRSQKATIRVQWNVLPLLLGVLGSLIGTLAGVKLVKHVQNEALTRRMCSWRWYNIAPVIPRRGQTRRQARHNPRCISCVALPRATVGTRLRLTRVRACSLDRTDVGQALTEVACGRRSRCGVLRLVCSRILQVCIDMCIDMCKGICFEMCIDMCMYSCMRMDMSIEICGCGLVWS